MTYLLLALSVVLSAGRNLLSKNLSLIRFGTRSFFLCQCMLFSFGGLALLCFGKMSWKISKGTLVFALFYALLLILAQWFYTAALSNGNTALCSTVYSLGFVLPTLSGALLWNEAFSPLDLCGVAAAISAVTVSGYKKRSEKTVGGAYYFIPLLIAMTASGGLGIVQKLQQKSAFADEKSAFLFIAFVLAAMISLAFSLFAKETAQHRLTRMKLAAAACIGVFFGCCNLLNTTLAGRLDSAIFFPTLNICVIFLSMLCGIIFFREKIRRREIAVLILGTASILLLNLG